MLSFNLQPVNYLGFFILYLLIGFSCVCLGSYSFKHVFYLFIYLISIYLFIQPQRACACVCACVIVTECVDSC